ncbi:MAG: hypothetical protein BRC33_05490 [Cyanobacteria bacterium SW_9_44_58]|nr:MAG: hypothetical protein BRC33_05490 [Cyanobacteria bacterium SW_9_44_58]
MSLSGRRGRSFGSGLLHSEVSSELDPHKVRNAIPHSALLTFAPDESEQFMVKLEYLEEARFTSLKTLAP